jgi:photosystem II stability/assembly factor-like uncharacterized protein
MRKYLPFTLIIFFLSGSLLFNQPSTFRPTGIGGGGALFAPGINPNNEKDFYLGCDMSELFHTTDFGLSYEVINFQKIRGGTNSTVRFTNNPDILYCINYANDIIVPVKSSDAGKTWKTLSGNPDQTEETYSIYVDYNNPDRIIISYYNQVYLSNDGGNKFAAIHDALDNGSGVIVGGVFFDGNSIFIGTNDGVLVSTDGGSTFTTATISGIPSNEVIFSFTGTKQNSIIRFFCLTADKNDVWVGVQGYEYWGVMKGIYSLDYPSAKWTSKMNGVDPDNDFLMYIGMAQNDINTCYISGSNTSSEPNIMKTSDGGSNWTHIFNTENNQNISTGWSGYGGDRGWGYGECVLGFAVAPNNSNKVIFTDLGFVHTTTNGGTTWKQAYISTSDENQNGFSIPKGKNYHSIGLENTSCWQIHWVDENNIFACFSDIKGIRSTDGGQSWSFNYTGHNANTMYRIIKHPNLNTLFAATSDIHDIYQSTRLADNLLDANDKNGKIIYSTDNGSSWKDLHYFGHPVFWIAIDPKNPNRMYASVIHHTLGGIYFTDDLNNNSTSNWVKLANPPRTEGHPATVVVLNDGSVVCTYSGRRAPGFTASSGVFIYDQNSSSWKDVSDPGMYYWTKDIVIDPNDPSQNTWYVGVFSGWGGPPNDKGGLYKTVDRGKNWKKINSLAQVTSCTKNPDNLNEMYLTTEQNGLWYSNNVNSSTPAFTLVSNYPFKQPERIFFNPFKKGEIWIASFGNGISIGNSVVDKCELLAELPKKITLFQNYPNPFNPSTKIEYSIPENTFVYLKIFNTLGKEIETLVNRNQSAGTYQVNWQPKSAAGGLPSGVYYYELRAGGFRDIKKMIYIR